MKAKAVFLDRDGTIIENRQYIGDPDEVRLLPGAGEAIRRFAAMGYLVVVVSNQSGIARGIFDEEDLGKVHARLEELLQAEGVTLDGVYYCPFLDGPEAKVEKYRRASELRKPKPGMLLQAAREMNIDLKESWMVGDADIDAQAGKHAGCRTILLQHGSDPTVGDADYTVATLAQAAELLEGDETDSSKIDAQPPGGLPGQEILQMLERIRVLLERTHRRERQHDFSVLRLFGALLQMFAIIAALWGTVGLLDARVAEATARLALACFLQLASIAAFTVDRLR